GRLGLDHHERQYAHVQAELQRELELVHVQRTVADHAHADGVERHVRGREAAAVWDGLLPAGDRFEQDDVQGYDGDAGFRCGEVVRGCLQLPRGTGEEALDLRLERALA